MFNIHSIYVKHKIHLKRKNNCCLFQKVDMLIWVHFFQWRKHDEVIEVRHTCIMYVWIHLPTTTTTKRSHTQQTRSMILNRKQQMFDSKMIQISIREFVWLCVLCSASTQISWTRVPPQLPLSLLLRNESSTHTQMASACQVYSVTSFATFYRSLT